MYQLDHIVHFVKDPNESIKDLSQQGLHVVAGGKHDAWGTYNALSYFGLTYIEFIGIYDEAVFCEAAQVPYTLHSKYMVNGRKNGLTKLAIRTTTIAQDALKLAEAGFDVIGPERFSRIRPDGSVVSWQLLYIGEKGSNVAYPFFIQWDEADEKRRFDMQVRGIIAPHTAGELVIEEVAVTVPHFNAFNSLYRALDVDMTITYDDIAQSEVATLHLDGGDILFQLADDEVTPFTLQYVKFAGAYEEKTIEYDGATYILSR